MTNLETTTETKKLKISETIYTKVEKEIDLPYYCKASEGSNTYLKVITKDRVVKVDTYDFNTGIEISDNRWSLVIASSVPITEIEFNEAFQIALTKIQNLFL